MSRTKTEQRFLATVWRYYEAHGRNNLPWRKTTNPYRILVSEIMLQQTQVERVIPKYRAFLKTFPTVRALAKAPLSAVLTQWQGLGYNRRAKYLHEAARAVLRDGAGKFPQSYKELLALPGVGPYTASAVMVFAYSVPQVLIETNIRTVFLHHFFVGQVAVPDKKILLLVERTLPQRQTSAWYAALMDYGTHLKQTHGNASRRSAAYEKQSPFKGSDRQVRGAVIRALTSVPSRGMTNKALTHALLKEGMVVSEKLEQQLRELSAEGLIAATKKHFHLPKS